MTNNSVFSVHAEESILSILINNPGIASEHSNLIPEMFSSIPSQFLFRTITDMVLDSLIPSVDLIKARLKTNGKIKTAGGDEYIDHIAKKNNDPTNFKEFEDIIINSYKTRKMLEISSTIPGMVGNNSNNVDNVISTVRNEIDDLTLTSSKNGVTKIADSLKFAYDVVQNRLENPGLSGLSTGFSNIDALTGGHSRGDVWVVAGRPSMGKTSYAFNSMLNTSVPVENSVKSLIFSLEMSKQTVMDRFLSIDSGVDLADLRLGSMKQEDVDNLGKTFHNLKDNNIYIDANFHTDPLYMMGIINRYHKTVGIDVVYIDYLQLLIERDEMATHEIGRVCRAMKKIAQDLNIAVCLISQLNRSVESRNDKRPLLSDLRQSGNIEEDADVVAFLYRDDVYYKDSHSKDVTEFIVRKNRNGPIGTVQLKFDKKTTKLTELI